MPFRFPIVIGAGFLLVSFTTMTAHAMLIKDTEFVQVQDTSLSIEYALNGVEGTIAAFSPDDSFFDGGDLSEPAITSFVLDELGLVEAALMRLSTELMFIDTTAESSTVTTITRSPDAVVIGDEDDICSAVVLQGTVHVVETTTEVSTDNYSFRLEATAVPEPSSFCCWSLLLAVAATAARRRRGKTQQK